MKPKTFPDFSFEDQFPDKIVIGVDEVGRGCLAGPVVAGATVIVDSRNEKVDRSSWLGLGINDSKKLTPKKREELAKHIKENCHGWGIGESSVELINSLGIVQATHLAMKQAVIQAVQSLSCSFRAEDIHIMVDGMPVKIFDQENWSHTAIIKGDGKSLSIASASIIAKVHRDDLMTKLHEDFPHYQWIENKGYGTKDHLSAIKNHGICPEHRTLFVRNIISKYPNSPN